MYNAIHGSINTLYKGSQCITTNATNAARPLDKCGKAGSTRPDETKTGAVWPPCSLNPTTCSFPTWLTRQSLSVGIYGRHKVLLPAKTVLMLGWLACLLSMTWELNTRHWTANWKSDAGSQGGPRRSWWLDGGIHSGRLALMEHKSNGVSAGRRVPSHRCEYPRFGEIGLDSGHTSLPNGSDRRGDIS